jgi:hypothetical protein
MARKSQAALAWEKTVARIREQPKLEMIYDDDEDVYLRLVDAWDRVTEHCRLRNSTAVQDRCVGYISRGLAEEAKA